MKDKVVLICGGEGGLGKDVTEIFLKAGANVAITYFSQKNAENNSSAGTNGAFRAIQADLTDEASVESLFATLAESYRQIDVLIQLVGGFWMGGDIAETPLNKWDSMMRLNLQTTFLSNRAAFRQMKANGGRIFNVAARTALELPAGMGAYSVSKAGVLALTEIIAKEGKPFDIEANAILPSIIDTPANRQSMPDADFDRWVKPREIGELLLALSQGERRLVSGTALKVYGKV